MTWTKFMAWAMLFLALSAIFQNTVVRAADVDEDDGEDIQGGEEVQAGLEEEDQAVEPSLDVATSYIFPDYPDQRLEIGEKITVLVSLHNKGQASFNVTAVGAFLFSPYDLSYLIQNFTGREVGALVQPGQEVTIDYTFTPDARLEPLDFHFTGLLEYNDTEGNQFRSSFFNGTLSFVEKRVSFDFKEFFTYFLLIAGLGLIVHIALTVQNKGKPKAVERGTTDAPASAATSWGGEIYKAKAKSVAVGKKRSNKKPSSKKTSESEDKDA